MSILKTKPNYGQNVVATQRGWMNSVTKEIYVAIANLPARIAEEEAKLAVSSIATEVKSESVPIEVVEEVKPIKEVEVVMEQKSIEVQEVRTKRAYNKKPKVIGEVVEHDSSKQVIGEVVEYDSDKQVIGE